MSALSLASAGMIVVETDANFDYESYHIGQYEVSWEEWVLVRDWAQDQGYDLAGVGQGCADDHPVHSVSWFDALKWSNARSEMEGLTPVYQVDGAIYRAGEHVPTPDLDAKGYRLPTAQEWEFAYKGGNLSEGYAYSGSDTLNEVGWYVDNSGGAHCDLIEGRGTWPVGLKAPNELMLYDMSGNVSERCWDLGMRSPSRPMYPPPEDPLPEPTGRRLAGHSFWSKADFSLSLEGPGEPPPPPIGFPPEDRRSTIGFRLAKSAVTGLWAGATEYDNGWLHSDWLGFIYPNDGLIYQDAKGWLYVLGDSTESLYIFDFDREAWFWTSESAYHWVYWFDGNEGWAVHEAS